MLIRQRLIICSLFSGLLFTGLLAQASEQRHVLLSDYQQSLKTYPLANSLALSSNISDERRTADIFGVVKHDFLQIKRILQKPENWCAFLPLHLNIKSCLVEKRADNTWLIVFAGRKYYQAPAESDRIDYKFILSPPTNAFLSISLSAKSGPAGTRDYLIQLQATPAATGSGTLIKVRSAYTSSTLSRMGTSIYLATLGKNKVGFSVTGLDDVGQPVYVGGKKGVIERNAMRYFLALTALFDSWHLSEAKRQKARIQQWFKQTQTYARQLYEMPKEDYVAIKKKEFANQIHLQRLLKQGETVSSLLDENDEED